MMSGDDIMFSYYEVLNRREFFVVNDVILSLKWKIVRYLWEFYRLCYSIAQLKGARGSIWISKLNTEVEGLWINSSTKSSQKTAEFIPNCPKTYEASIILDINPNYPITLNQINRKSQIKSSGSTWCRRKWNLSHKLKLNVLPYRMSKRNNYMINNSKPPWQKKYQ